MRISQDDTKNGHPDKFPSFLGFSFIDKMRSLSSFESPNSNRKFTLHFPLDCFTRERQ